MNLYIGDLHFGFQNGNPKYNMRIERAKEQLRKGKEIVKGCFGENVWESI